MISKLFINRPIVAMVIAIVTVIGGLVAMAGLPVAQFPEIVPPQIIVNTTYTGADAVTIEQSVATPLEQQMSGVDNMLYMQSTNANDGTMTLTVTFDIDTNPNIDQVNRNTDAGNCNLFAASKSRLTFPRQLREHKHQRCTLSCSRCRPGSPFRRQRLRDAHLGQT
jgi:multidrug efflux pump subunit AcrB